MTLCLPSLVALPAWLVEQDRVQGRAPAPPRQYDSPDAFQHDVLGHISSLPGNTTALRREFLRLFKMWTTYVVQHIRNPPADRTDSHSRQHGMGP